VIFADWLWISIGLIIIYFQFKKFSSKERFMVYEWENENNPLLGRRKRKAKLKNDSYKSIALFASFVWVIFITNISLDYLRGWFVSILFGLFCAYVIKTNSIVEFESKLYEKNTIEQETVIKDKIKNENKSALMVLIFTLAISLNWGYQVQKTENEDKLIATNAVTNIVGRGWCAEFWDIDATPGADGDYSVSKSGGWPCITVGSVSNISFTNKKDDLEMCFSFSLRRSNDGPWNYDSSEEYDYGSTCASDSWIEEGGGWSEDSLWENVRNEINLESELNSFKNTMCRNYYWRMSSGQQIVYC
jgi:hypothetical protein